MKYIILISTIFAVLIFSMPSLAQTQITSCTSITSPGEYVLANDIIDSTASTCIDIQANNVILDCQGHLIDGIDDSSVNNYGILIYRNSPQETNITIKNCVVTDYEDGIYIYQASNNKVINCTSNSNTANGIFLDSPVDMIGNNLILNCTARENVGAGIFISVISNNTIENCDLESNSYGGIGIKNSGNNSIKNCYVFIPSTIAPIAGIDLDSANNNTIDNLTIIYESSSSPGIYIRYGSSYNVVNNTYINSANDGIRIENDVNSDNYNVIQNTKISFAGDNGIYIYYSSRNKIINSVINSSYNYNIYIWASNYNEIVNSTIENCSYDPETGNGIGIFVGSSSNNTVISGNLIRYNTQRGIYISQSRNVTIYNNIIQENGEYGIRFYSVSGSTIYNNLFNNTVNFGLGGNIYANYWNTTLQPGTNIVGGPYIGGNYWGSPDGTGYSDTCSDSNNDGICDDPYTLTTNNIDYLPLAKVQVTPSPSGGITSTQITTSTVTVNVYVSILLSAPLAGGVQFGNLDPGTSNNPSITCQGLNCNITVSPDTNVNVDIVTKANAPLTSSTGATIPLDNYKWNATSNAAPSGPAYALKTTYDYTNKVGVSLIPGQTVTIQFWLDVPLAQAAGTYNNTLYFCGQEAGTTNCGS